jgi:zinc transport system ATP-binding protein
MSRILELRDVSFSYGSTRVLSRINLVVEKQDFIGLIGPNGSGKTTLVKLILGILPMQKGAVFVDGISLSKFTDWSKIGYVPQKATSIDAQFPATVEEVVSMGLLATKSFPKLIRTQDMVKVSEALRAVRMQQYASRRIGELSGGQQQRVLIAKAMICDPQILILDEPTTGIDTQSQQTFYDLLAELNKRGVTIMLISHDVTRITKYVTKVASLNQTLEFYGTHAQFCSHDKSHKHEHQSHDLCLSRG